MAHDIERVRAETSMVDLAFGFGVNLKQDGQEWVACCPLHEETTPSFTIWTGSDGVERFQCFGCGERGDVIDLTKAIKGVDTRGALKILGGDTSRPNVKPKRVDYVDPYAGINPLPPRGEIQAGKRIDLYNPKRAGSDREWGGCKPVMVFPYRAADGSLIGYVLRNEFNGTKETPMVMWCQLPDGREAWCRYPFPKPRPLYGLDTLRPDRQVILVEGEKCRDALASAMPDRLVMSWPGGTYGINHTDWTPLAGRSVVIWPDADPSGVDTAENIAAILHGLQASPRVMDVIGGSR